MSIVQVTYSAPAIYLSSDQCSQIRAAITSQFPLKNVTWKSSFRPAARTIAKLDISFVNLDTIREEHASQIPQSLLEKPFLNVYITSCEDTDVYKTTVRRQIKDWLGVVGQKRNQEWLILLVVRQDNRSSTTPNFFQIKSNVLERIKADFNTDKRDRCVQLMLSQGTVASPAYVELMLKIKEAIVVAFDGAISQRIDEIRRSENQRQMPGWNFCTFFILKETLASTFVGMNLFEDAILTYSELEASFLQAQSSSLSGHISWFGKLINPDPGDDSFPLLDITKKPYRDLILHNTITIFDFRVYLLAKHCEALGLNGQVTELTRLVSNFLSAFSQRLKSSKVYLPPFFIESWVFSSAFNVVLESDKWISSADLDTVAVSNASAAKGELLELARIQLDKIGIHSGHLPNAIPFSISLPNHEQDSEPSTPSTPTESSKSKITSKMILESMSSQTAFDKLYLDITNRAIELFVKGGRRKSALRLHGYLAALHLERLRRKEAYQLYSSLPAHYTPHTWTSLATFMQLRRLDAHDKLENPRNQEWVDIVMSFLKGFVEDHMHVHLALPGKEDLREYIGNLLQSVTEAVSGIDMRVVVNDHPMLSIMLQSEEACHTDDEDGSYIKVMVRNALPCDIAVDTIRLSFNGPNSERLEFTVRDQVIVPGSTVFTLSTPNPTYGLFVLDSSEVLLKNLKLRSSYTFDVKHGRISAYKQHSSLLRIPRDYGAINIRIDEPKSVKLDDTQNILLTIFSGRNNIAEGAIKLPDSHNVQFLVKDTKRVGGNARNMDLDCSEGRIQFWKMDAESHLQLEIPYKEHTVAEALKITAELQYWTSSDRTSMRRANFIRHVSTSLPLVIQAHDHFRNTSLISSYTISTAPGTYQHIRVSSVKLESVEDEQGGLVITGCRPSGRLITITPSQSAHCLFRVQSDQPRTHRASLNLRIKFRLLREEVENLLSFHVSAILKTVNKPVYLGESIQNRLLKALENDAGWVEMYHATGELLVNSSALPEDESQDLYPEISRMVIESLRENKLIPDKDFWKEVVIPVDLPFKNVTAATDIQIHSVSESRTYLYAGQPVTATVTISSSCHWAGPIIKVFDEPRYAMRFEVHEMPDDWLISGQKKGEFVVTDGCTHSVPITLIPLHHGELALPQVNLHPLPTSHTAGGSGSSFKVQHSVEVYQKRGAERIIVLPTGGSTSFVVDLGE